MLPPRGKWTENAFNKGLGFWCTKYSHLLFYFGFWCTKYSLVLFYLFILKRKSYIYCSQWFSSLFRERDDEKDDHRNYWPCQWRAWSYWSHWLADPCANHYRPVWRRKTSSLLLLSTVVLKMAPLDLDKYVEIARQCKYLPENDLKVTMISNSIFLSKY